MQLLQTWVRRNVIPVRIDLPRLNLSSSSSLQARAQRSTAILPLWLS